MSRTTDWVLDLEERGVLVDNEPDEITLLKVEEERLQWELGTTAEALLNIKKKIKSMEKLK